MVLRVKNIEQDNCRTILLGHMTLESCVFDLFYYPFLGTSVTVLNGNSSVTEGYIMGGHLFDHT